jgi:hypothetical protein
MRAQKAKGASAKQAEARWKFKQRHQRPKAGRGASRRANPTSGDRASARKNPGPGSDLVRALEASFDRWQTDGKMTRENQAAIRAAIEKAARHEDFATVTEGRAVARAQAVKFLERNRMDAAWLRKANPKRPKGRTPPRGHQSGGNTARR